MTETLSLRGARRLALARAGLLPAAWSGLPDRAGARERTARAAAHEVIRRFGYLQLDTVSVAGARSHALVLLSRLSGLPPRLGEELLQPGEPLFEYWGHEASWIPLKLYPAFSFRREEYRVHPWWGDLLGEHRQLADELLRRIEQEGPLRSLDLEGEGGKGWWQLKAAKKLVLALWSAGELAVRERRGFQRTYDLTERVIPERWRRAGMGRDEALRQLLLVALGGHGWATSGTLAATWRLRNQRQEIQAALAALRESGEIVACTLAAPGGAQVKGWARPADLELAARLQAARPSAERAVLLSPFDPLLWDRNRVRLLFGFTATLEIFKPAPQRVYGYYCLPVLAGERLVARVDLKAHLARGELAVLATHLEAGAPRAKEAVAMALERYSTALGLGLATADGAPRRTLPRSAARRRAPSPP